MKYRRFEDTIVARLDKGDEIMESIKTIIAAENIKLAHVSALGATDDFHIGVFDMTKKQYNKRHITGAVHEICSLNGTINTMNGEPYIHVHITAASGNGEVVGGHFIDGTICLTCEMVITVIHGEIDRIHDDVLDINIYKMD